MLENPNAHGFFFSPLPKGLTLNTTKPKQVIGHYRKVQGRFGGTGTVPSFPLTMLFFSSR